MCFACFDSATRARQCWCICRPVSVMDRLRLVRFSRRTPSSSSRARTRRLSLDVCTPSARAAAVKLARSTTSAKRRRLLRSLICSMGDVQRGNIVVNIAMILCWLGDIRQIIADLASFHCLRTRFLAAADRKRARVGLPKKEAEMLAHRRWESLDQADHGWLHAKYHFLVNAQGNQAHHALGPLIVWNDE